MFMMYCIQYHNTGSFRKIQLDNEKQRKSIGLSEEKKLVNVAACVSNSLYKHNLMTNIIILFVT